ncbi:MAG: SH3 domain-containing protein [Prolixibacteraceae bacterium]|nr:SH3 domain-containing protein [Prolixibacteraceae bacterium]
MKKTFLTLLFCVTILFAIGQTSEQYIVTSQTLNVRNGAGKQYEIIATLSQGDIVSVIEKTTNDWWNVDFNGDKGFVFSSLLKPDPYSGWEVKNYESGVTPECENVTPQYDINLDNFLRINVGSGTDVVVKLMKKGLYDDECIRIVYIRSTDTFEIKNIPEGRYYLKIAYGSDYRQKIVDNQCYVKFMNNAQYEKGSEILDFNKVKQPNQRIGNEIYENWSVPSFELLLDVIVNKGNNSTFKTNDISEAEFNK